MEQICLTPACELRLLWPALKHC